MSSLLLVSWRGQKQLPEADALLLHAYSLHKAALCPCGCGHPADVALDPLAADAVEVDDSTRCAFRAAIQQWQSESKDAELGTLPVATLDEKAYEIAKARASRD